MAKQRHGAPNCKGRFSKLRERAVSVAWDLKDVYEDPLWSIVTMSDLNDFVKEMESNGTPLQVYDITDPYFYNRKDTLRGDPLVGNEENKVLSMVPFVFEAMRSTLQQDVEQAKSIIEESNGDPKKMANLLGSIVQDTVSEEGVKMYLQWTVVDLVRVEEKEISHLTTEEQVQLLKPIAERDWTISANAVDTSLLTQYASLYVNNDELLDSLRLIHRGMESLDRELEIDMSGLRVPLKNKRGYVGLSGLYLKAEFGTGLNVERNLMTSAPYRIQIKQNGKKFKTGDGNPVMGMSFYLKHPNTMVIYQIQDIRGARVPEGTTDGLVGLTVMEEVGKKLGFDRLETYSACTNPVKNAYPNDSGLCCILKMNFDEAAKGVGWEPIRLSEVKTKEGQIVAYARQLK